MKVLGCSKYLLIALLGCLSLSACQKPAGDDSDSPSPSPAVVPDNDSSRDESSTDCGVVMDGSLHNPVTFEEGQKVRVKQVVSDNLLIVQDYAGIQGPVLVKLHGIKAGSTAKVKGAMNMLKSMSSGAVAFFKAASDCNVTLDDGGKGTIGQLMTSKGVSFSEAIVRAGLAEIDNSDACGGDQIGACLNSLSGTEVQTMGEVKAFLWKPLSDTKGPILVMHEYHCNATVFVNGQELEYRGSGNGRCGTYIGTKSGCGYGSNIRVQVVDKSTGRPYTYKGETTIIIPNGCNRVELNP